MHLIWSIYALTLALSCSTHQLLPPRHDQNNENVLVDASAGIWGLLDLEQLKQSNADHLHHEC